MLPADDKIQKFRRIAANDQPLKLINNYRGFPITSSAQIDSIEDGYLNLRVYEYQAVCLTLEGFTYVQHSSLPEVYRASVLQVDIPRRAATITEFIGAGSLVGNRTYIRVQPKEAVPLEIYTGEQRIPGKLVDISTLGMGIFTLATFVYSERVLKVGDELLIDLQLPSHSTPVRLHTQVANVSRQQGEYLHRLGVRILPGSPADELLRLYVTTRQDEIMKELSIIYNSLRSEQKKGESA